MAKVAALTGTPGTGKTTVSRILASHGWTEVDLTDLARGSGSVVGRDEDRDTDEVDVALLGEAVARRLKGAPDEGALLLVGHLAHLLPVDVSVVLRCSPAVLRRRLEGRGYPPGKVEENAEAEAVGVVLAEAMELVPQIPVYEVDTTDVAPERTAEEVLSILSGGGEGLEGGWVDWSEEVMGWF